MVYNIFEVIMKKRLITIFILTITFSLLFAMPSIAYADNTTPNYYKVTGENVRFYLKIDDAPSYQFSLPKSYFVKVDSNTPEFEVEGVYYMPIIYNGEQGYVNKNNLTDNNLTAPTSEELKKLTDNNAYFKKSVTLKNDFTSGSITIVKDTKLDFFGMKGGNYVFCYNKKYISIPANQGSTEYFDAFTIPSHTFPSDNNSNVITDGTKLNPYNKLATILLTIGIVIPAVIIVLMIFKPVKTKTERDNYYNGDYYDEYRDKYHTKRKKQK